MIENNDLIIDLIKSIRGKVHNLKGRGNSDKLISFAQYELPILKDFLYDALSHHLSGYNYHLKNGDEVLADKHMRYFHQYMDLAERLANENPSHMSVEIPADIQHWEQNAKVNKDGTPNNSTLHGWRLNQSDYSHVRKAPHPKYTQRIQEHGHTGAYPFELIKINGKYLDIDPDFDPTPSKRSPHDKEASINHHGMDYHPLMRAYIVNKKSVPYFALSANDRQKIAEGKVLDRDGKKIEQPDPDVHYSEIEKYFVDKILPKMHQYKQAMDDYFKEIGKDRGAEPSEGVHSHLKVKHLNIHATHGHLGQKEVSSGKVYPHVSFNKNSKTLFLSTDFLKKAAINKQMLGALDTLIELHGGAKNVIIKNAETGEEIKNIEEWYKNNSKEEQKQEDKKPETKEETQQKPKAEPQPEPKQEPQPEPKQEPQPEPQAEAKQEPKQEPKVETQPEPKQEPKVETQPEPKQEPKVETQPESKPEQKTRESKESFYSKLKNKLGFFFGSQNKKDDDEEKGE